MEKCVSSYRIGSLIIFVSYIILNMFQKAVQTKKECEKLAFEQKLTTNKLEGVTRRTDIVSYALLAELNHFYGERTEEVSKSLKNFLSQQISFFQKVSNIFFSLINIDFDFI